MRSRIAAAGTLGVAILAAGEAGAIDSIPMLNLEIAKRMADACEAKAAHEGWRMNIAVVDRGADIVLFRRMDNAFLGSVEIATDKATTSARFPFSTRLVMELGYGKGDEPAGLPGLVEVDEVIAFPGGLPIMAGSTHIGGIGISGDTADNDEACAQAAIDAVAGVLN